MGQSASSGLCRRALPSPFLPPPSPPSPPPRMYLFPPPPHPFHSPPYPLLPGSALDVTLHCRSVLTSGRCVKSKSHVSRALAVSRSLASSRAPLTNRSGKRFPASSQGGVSLAGAAVVSVLFWCFSPLEMIGLLLSMFAVFSSVKHVLQLWERVLVVDLFLSHSLTRR